ncbi:Bll2908 protein [Vibrio maritimus]|uniref:Bll2908 protein n=1 Tax=Vibrio maritimus TaxID=990268 RepID=A0A090SMH3_9VIBR|nr:Bll2908 protein [Vibrio maritimus]
MSKIYLIHAVEIAIKPIKEAFESHWPEAELVHLWDETLSIERAKTKQLTPFLNRRIEELVKLAIEGGADAIMFTCSAFGSAIERAANNAAIPVLKPNQAMFEKAIALSGNIACWDPLLPLSRAWKKNSTNLQQRPILTPKSQVFVSVKLEML